MPASALIYIVESTSALAVLALLVFWLIPNYRLDRFRQDVFSLRDELFDYALAGNISFSHPAYRLLRQSANGFIRYAHRLTLYKVILTATIWKVIGHEPELVWTNRWNEAIASLDDKTRSDLVRFHERLGGLIAERVVFGSPFLIVALVLTAVIMFCKAGVISLHAALKESARGTVAHVVDPRLLEEEAVEAKVAA